MYKLVFHYRTYRLNELGRYDNVLGGMVVLNVGHKAVRRWLDNITNCLVAGH